MKPKKSVRDYLDALVWDRKPRIDRWLVDYAGASDTPHVRGLSRAVLVAAVRRARQPGCLLDGMLILEGPQGSGKSSALRLLADDEWFTSDLSLDTRALMESTAGKWIVEASELKAMGGGDIAAFKACLSQQVDEARLAYQRESTRVPRSFVIVGTTSETDYLRDTTGNRRFWPVRVERFDLDRLKTDRDQIWAEAAVAEAAGDSARFADPLSDWSPATGETVLVEDHLRELAQDVVRFTDALSEFRVDARADEVAETFMRRTAPSTVTKRRLVRK